MSSETEQGPERSSPHGWWGGLYWPGVILLAYVLSTGPVVMMADKRVVTPGSPAGQFIGVLYLPVRFALKTPLRKPLGMYWHLWAPGSYDSKGNPLLR